MTKYKKAYDLLLRWENDPSNCEGVNCYGFEGDKDCPFAPFCFEAREIVKEDSKWFKKGDK